MIEVVRTVSTGTPRPVVAAYLSDFTTTADWDPHTKSCRRVGAGPVQVGVEYDNTQRIGLGSTTLRYRVHSLVPGESVELHSSSARLDAVDRMDFADAAGGGTTVTYTARFTLKGPAKIAAPVLRRMLTKVADDGAIGMQAALDRTGTGTDPGT